MGQAPFNSEWNRQATKIHYENHQKVLVAENTKINAILNIHKQLLISDENIRIEDQLKDFRNPHMIRSTLMPSICKSELVIAFVKPL